MVVDLDGGRGELSMREGRSAENGRSVNTASILSTLLNSRTRVGTGYFARFHTISNVNPASVRGFVNFISSAVMDVMIRR
jgi:hypothetical protein